MQISPDTQLPSLPEVTLRALEACQQEDSYRTISDIIATDTALVARVLALANSSLYGRPGEVRSLEQALLRLGTDRIRTLILTAALRQLLFDLGADQWQQLRDFWRHSLTTALTAKALATLTRYPAPDEAFMLGMVHNIGELIALRLEPGDRQQQALDRQAEIGAQFALAWGLGPMAADAMRYQQAPPAGIRDAAHLVKLINLSTRLAQADAAGVAAAGTIFGISEDLTREICLRINHEVETLAESLGVSLASKYDGRQASDTLHRVVVCHAMTDQSLAFIGHHDSAAEMLASTVSNLTLLTGCPALFFAARADNLKLLATSQGECPEMTVVTSPALSVLTRSHRDRAQLQADPAQLTVLDQQLQRLLQTSTLMAVPVVTGNQCHGVFVLGLEPDDVRSAGELSQLFTRRLAQLIAQRQDSLANTGDDLDEAIRLDNIRRQIHEISNPLTIIRQYIYQLRGRLDNEEVRDELDIIRDELERAGNLLVQMGESHQPHGSHSPGGNRQRDESHQGERQGRDRAVLNDELRALNELFEDSLFRNHEVSCTLNLSSASTRVACPRAKVRQVVINLTRNAVESIGDGGHIGLTTTAPVWQNGRQWIELLVEDNGPGLPEAVQKRLFLPVASNKGAGHSGLGLSIVKQLIDDMEGIISCHTGERGTRFRILLPAATDQEDSDS